MTCQKAAACGRRSLPQSQLIEMCVRAAVNSLRSRRTGVGVAWKACRWNGRGDGSVATFAVARRDGGTTRAHVFEYFHCLYTAHNSQLCGRAVGDPSGRLGLWDRGPRRANEYTRVRDLVADRPHYLLWEHPPADELACLLCNPAWASPETRLVARDALADWVGVDDLPGHDPGARTPAAWLMEALGKPMLGALLECRRACTKR